MNMELEGGVAELPRNGLLQSTSKRVRMIFSVMASPNRIDILKILNSKGPLTYSELKSLAGFKNPLLDLSQKKKVENLHTI
jgi:ribonucleoside-triphosphate reductase